LSLLHGDSRISARVKRDNSTGSVLWNGRSFGIAQMIDIPAHSDVRAGDTIVTSGWSLDFPEGIPIGIVERVLTQQGDNFHSLDIRLTTNFNTIDHVYVVRNLARNELEKLQEHHIKDE
jgi:rod shape-determining protein MreC